MNESIYTGNEKAFDSRLGNLWEDLEFMAHEITHVDQYKRLGLRGFGIAYVAEGVFQAMITPASKAFAEFYESNLFEVKAGNNAKRIIKKLKKDGKSPCSVEVGVIATVEVN